LKIVELYPLKYTVEVIFCVLMTLTSCAQAPEKGGTVETRGARKIPKAKIINEQGMTVVTRFNTPPGFIRIEPGNNSFAFYLRNLPLKPAGSKVHYYDGTIKGSDVYDAVIDMDIGDKNLQQCADAVIRLRAEYFYSLKEYEMISFSLTNGFKVDYTEWMKGKRVAVNGNKTSWIKSSEPSNTYKDFRNYLEFIFNYAGTLSLSKSLKPKDIKSISIGDVFILGGSPGHAVIVIDVAENKKGEKIFLLAQSYMPAQDIHLLINPVNNTLSPWYELSETAFIETPEYTFNNDELKRW